MNEGENKRRRLPPLRSPTGATGSSDETPRIGANEDNARQRRRNQQKLARQQTPNGRDSASPAEAAELPLPPRSNKNGDIPMKKRRRARRIMKSQEEPSLLQGFEDEIITEKSVRRSSGTILPDLVLPSSHTDGLTSHSTQANRVYFENKKTISSVNKDNAALRIASRAGQSPFVIGRDDGFTFQQQTAEVLKRYTIQVAKQTHVALQKIFLFLHGFQSGFALWICVFGFIFTNVSAENFFQTYRSFALITHLLFYLFLAVCMVDVLDRIDPVKFDRTTLLHSITAQNSAIALIFYAVAMVVNLVMMKTEDALRMSQQQIAVVNSSKYSVSYIATNSTTLWTNLTAVRAAFIVVGWFIVAIHVKKDRLSSMIKNTEDKAFYEELNIEQNTVPLTPGKTSS